MGKVREAIDDATAAWLARQQMFFVATAPLAEDGHVNLSPKGLDTYGGQRDRLLDWAVKRGPEGLADYWADVNAESIDGLPGLPVPAARQVGA